MEITLLRSIARRLLASTPPIPSALEATLLLFMKTINGTFPWPVHLTRPPTPVVLGQTSASTLVVCTAAVVPT